MEARDIDHFSTPLQYLCVPRPAMARHLLARGAEPDIFGHGDFRLAVFHAEIEFLHRVEPHVRTLVARALVVGRRGDVGAARKTLFHLVLGEFDDDGAAVGAGVGRAKPVEAFQDPSVEMVSIEPSE